MRRIMIDAAKCDGCKSCSVACMQAHRKDDGNVYTLDLTDITLSLIHISEPTRRS